MRKGSNAPPQRSSSSARFGGRSTGLFQHMLKRKKKVVVALVDDDDRWLGEIAAVLQEIICDCEVIVARDGEEALSMLSTYAGDLRCVLIDMVMPGMSGIELLNRCRANPRLANCSFALMTEFQKSVGGAKKTVAQFQVRDDDGNPVSVFIKPIHKSILTRETARANLTEFFRGLTHSFFSRRIDGRCFRSERS